MKEIDEIKIKIQTQKILNPILMYYTRFHKDIELEEFNATLMTKLHPKQKPQLEEGEIINIDIKSIDLIKESTGDSVNNLIIHIKKQYELLNYNEPKINWIIREYIKEFNDRFYHGKNSSIQLETAYLLDGLDSPNNSKENYNFEGFDIIKVIGKGGQGKVSKVCRKEDQELVVIKEFSSKKDYDHEKEIIKLLEKSNPGYFNYNYSEVKSKDAISMELAYGTFSDLIDLMEFPQFKLTDHQILCIMYIFVDFEKELNKLGLYHRDIKPNNIIINKLYSIQFIDYGSSVRLDSKKEIKSSYAATEGYFPKIKIEKFDEKILLYFDLYAIGITILQLIDPTFNPRCKSYKKILCSLKSAKNEIYKFLEQLFNKNLLVEEYLKDLRNHLTKEKDATDYCYKIFYNYFEKIEKEFKRKLIKPSSYETTPGFLKILAINDPTELMLRLNHKVENKIFSVTKNVEDGGYYYQLGQFYYDQNNLNKMVYNFMTAVDIFNYLNDKTHALLCYQYLSFIALKRNFMSDFCAAEENILDIISYASDKDHYIMHSYLGFYFYLNDKYTESLKYYEQSQTKSVENLRYQAISLNNIGCILSETNIELSILKLDQACQYFFSEKIGLYDVHINELNKIILDNKTTDYFKIDNGYEYFDMILKIPGLEEADFQKDKKINLIFFNLLYVRCLKLGKLFYSKKFYLDDILNLKKTLDKELKDKIICFFSAYFFIKLVDNKYMASLDIKHNKKIFKILEILNLITESGEFSQMINKMEKRINSLCENNRDEEKLNLEIKYFSDLEKLDVNPTQYFRLVNEFFVKCLNRNTPPANLVTMDNIEEIIKQLQIQKKITNLKNN